MKTNTHTAERHTSLDRYRLGADYRCECGYFATKRTEAEKATMMANLDKQFTAEERAIGRSESRNA